MTLPRQGSIGTESANTRTQDAIARKSREPRDAPTAKAKDTETVFRESSAFHRLTDEQKDLFNMMANFTRKDIAPRLVEMDEARAVPEELIQELRALGLFGITIPEEHGGAGCGATENAIVHEQLAYGSGSVAVLPSVSGGLVGGCLALAGTEEQKKLFLPRIASGEIIACFGLTEPNCGSDVASLETSAKRVAGGWVLNGTKIFATNAPISNYGIIFAVTGEKGDKYKNISAFIVPNGEGGFSTGRVYEKVGWRASKTSDIILDNVFVPDENLLGGEAWLNRGFKLAMLGLDKARISISAQALGVAERAFDEAVQYTQQRKTFGEYLCEIVPIRNYVVEMLDAIETMRLHVYSAAWLADNDKPVTQAASLAKMVCGERLKLVADRASQIFGATGTSVESPIAVCALDARIYPIVEGTTEIQRLVVARDLYGF